MEPQVHELVTRLGTSFNGRTHPTETVCVDLPQTVVSTAQPQALTSQ